MRAELEELREVSATFAKELGPETLHGDQGRVLIEMFNGLAYRMLKQELEKRRDPLADPGESGLGFQDLMYYSRALKDAGAALRYNQDFETKLRASIAKQAAAAVDEVAKDLATKGKDKGLSAETVAMIKERVLGVRAARPEQ